MSGGFRSPKCSRSASRLPGTSRLPAIGVLLVPRGVALQLADRSHRCQVDLNKCNRLDWCSANGGRGDGDGKLFDRCTGRSRSSLSSPALDRSFPQAQNQTNDRNPDDSTQSCLVPSNLCHASPGDDQGKQERRQRGTSPLVRSPLHVSASLASRRRDALAGSLTPRIRSCPVF